MIALLGAGKMGGALVRGWITAGVLDPDSVVVYEPHGPTADALVAATSVRLARSIEEAASSAQTLLVAVKPHLVVSVLKTAAPHLHADCLVISIAAGTRIDTIQTALPATQPVIRVLPNTPALIQSGAAAFARGTHVTQEQADLTQRLFQAVGIAAEVTEAQLDGALGVSSSGVAFAYLFLEALIDGGVCAGLPRPIARAFAAQTLLGAARMVQLSDEHPGELKDAVTTPGGTTITGLEILEKAGVRGAVIEAVRAAAEKSRALG